MRSRTPLKALLFLPMQRPAWKTPYIALQNTNAETKPGNDEQMRQLHGTHNDTSHGRTPRWRGVYKSSAFYKRGHTNSSGMVQRLYNRQRIDRLAHDGN